MLSDPFITKYAIFFDPEQAKLLWQPGRGKSLRPNCLKDQRRTDDDTLLHTQSSHQTQWHCSERNAEVLCFCSRLGTTNEQ